MKILEFLAKAFKENKVFKEAKALSELFVIRLFMILAERIKTLTKTLAAMLVALIYQPLLANALSYLRQKASWCCAMMQGSLIGFCKLY